MISLKCPNCNAELSVNEGRDVLYCEYCGHKILLGTKHEFTYTYHEIDEAKIKKHEVHEKIKLKKLDNEYKSKRILLIVGLLCLGYSVLAPLLMSFEYKSSINKYENSISGESIAVPFSSSDLTSEKYEVARTELENVGFTNITYIPINDFGILEAVVEGKVSEVSIDGKNSFKAGQRFPINAPVIIRYHSAK